MKISMPRIFIWLCQEILPGDQIVNPGSVGWSDEYQHPLCIRNHYPGASRPGLISTNQAPKYWPFGDLGMLERDLQPFHGLAG
jgi:hypothetical protein